MGPSANGTMDNFAVGCNLRGHCSYYNMVPCQKEKMAFCWIPVTPCSCSYSTESSSVFVVFQVRFHKKVKEFCIQNSDSIRYMERKNYVATEPASADIRDKWNGAILTCT